MRHKRKEPITSSAKGANLKIGKEIELSKYIDTEIKNKISPEVIAEKIKNNETFNIKTCFKTIYNYIDDGVLISTGKDLICGNYRSSNKKYKSEKAITTDNEREFLNFKGIEKSYTGSKIKRTIQYFATAYCSWQRGISENINKMIITSLLKVIK